MFTIKLLILKLCVKIAYFSLPTYINFIICDQYHTDNEANYKNMVDYRFINVIVRLLSIRRAYKIVQNFII